MQDLENISRQLQQSGKAADRRKAVEQAAKSGDGEALKRMLGQVLSTREGQRLAGRIQELMQK